MDPNYYLRYNSDGESDSESTLTESTDLDTDDDTMSLIQDYEDSY